MYNLRILYQVVLRMNKFSKIIKVKELIIEMVNLMKEFLKKMIKMIKVKINLQI
jgi:hypothetical protein